MSGMSWAMFGPAMSMIYITLAATVFFVYAWLRTHGSSSYMSNTRVDSMAGDEGED